MEEKLFGPYTRKDNGRKQLAIIKEDGSHSSISYPKWLMEQFLGRKLEDWETVDHIDRDFTNDSLDNLRVINKKEHISDDVKRVKKIKFNCVFCGMPGERSPKDWDNNIKKGKSGPFCSKSCVGKYKRLLQLNKIQKINPPELCEREYFYVEKEIPKNNYTPEDYKRFDEIKSRVFRHPITKKVKIPKQPKNKLSRKLKERTTFYCSCGNKKDKRSSICKICSGKSEKPKKFSISKEELEILIQTKPYTEIGKMFGVSDNAIKKRAKRLGIPLENRLGYWTRTKRALESKKPNS